MRKFTLFLASLLLTGLSLKGQTVTDSSGTTNVDSLYQLLDTSLINTGILIDKVSPNHSLDLYDGSCNDCYLTSEQFNQKLLELKMARMHGNTYLDSIEDKYTDHLSSHRSIPLQIANLNYNQIKDYALDSNLLENNGGLVDEGINTSESPYLIKRFVGLAAPVELRPQGLSFTLDSAFYFSNDSASLSQVQVDLGDGQGYQTVNFGQTLYPQYGELSEPGVEIGIKLSINGQIYTAKAKMTVILCSNATVPVPVAPPWSNTSQFQFGNLVAEETYDPNGHATGNVYVHYRSNPDPGTENQFKKPLIVVEGIDFEPYNQQNAANYQMGQFGWCALWGQDIDNYPQLAKMSQLLNDYHANDYDIIMLDFKDGATDIKENAYLLQTLIKKVNQYKTADAEANVVIGASMGAIVARYALADMEADGNDHCTRSFLSFDGPHQGANVPRGAQHAIRFFATNGVKKFAKAKEQLADLNRIAAKQLLISHISGGLEHINFFNELQIKGYPRKCKNIAIASGSGNGTNQGYNGGDQIVDYYYFSNNWGYWERAELRIWSLPGRSSDNAIFKGRLEGGWAFVNKRAGLKVMATPSWPHYDNSPGGIRPIAEEIADIDTDGKGNIISLNDNQSFIPTISALDINTNNLFFNASSMDPNNPDPNLTPFDAIYFPTDNTFHVEATDGNPPSQGDNIAFAKTKVKLGQAVSSHVLSSTYNYGEELNSVVTHTQVIGNGKLYLYGNFNDSRSGSTPPSSNTQIYKLGNDCASENLTIEQGGELIIGDATAGNKAQFIISEGSRLTLGNNGTLKIKEGSKLIIEDGANFTFEDGATIQLQGPNAELVIQGKLIVGPNATFTFTGDGQMVFDQNIPWVTANGNTYQDLTNYMDIGSGARFELIGPSAASKADPLLVVKKNAILKDQNNNIFDQVTIQNGAVELAHQQYLFIASPTDIIDVEVRRHDPNALHSGVRIWNGNNYTNYVRRTDFSGGNPAMLVHGFGSTGETRFIECEFQDSYDALRFSGGHHYVSMCDFFGNDQYDIRGEALNGQTFIGGSNFTRDFSKPTGVTTAIQLKGQAGSHLQMTENIIDGAHLMGINLEGIDFDADCNDIMNSHLGLRTENLMLYMNEEASNKFINNTAANIWAFGDAQGNGLFFANGHNRFDFPTPLTSNFEHIQGDFDGYLFDGDFTMPGQTLDLNFNHFDVNPVPPGTILFPIGIRSATNPNQVYQILVDYNVNNKTDPTCATGPLLNEFHPLVASISSKPPCVCLWINPPGGGTEIPGDQGLQSALEELSYDGIIRNDKKALDDLLAFFEGTITYTDTAAMEATYHFAYEGLLQAFNATLQQGQIAHNEGEPNPVDVDVDRVIAVIDDFIADVNPLDSNDHGAYFNYHLDKVHSYRVAGYYSEALAELASKAQWTFNHTQQQRTGYWQCVCEAEQDYYSGELPAEEFAYSLEQCQNTYRGYAYKNERTSIADLLREPQQEQVIEVYPQPVVETLNIMADQAIDGNTRVRIYNIQGALMLSEELEMQGGEMAIDMRSLPPGLYIVTLNNHKLNNNFRVLKK